MEGTIKLAVKDIASEGVNCIRLVQDIALWWWWWWWWGGGYQLLKKD
jgi:hypothetical protein